MFLASKLIKEKNQKIILDYKGGKIMRSILILLIFILSLPAPLFSSGGDIPYNGNDNGNDIMLQSFH